MALVAGTANTVHAYEVYPYIGLDVAHYKTDLAKNPTMVGVVGGVQFNDHFGLEASFSQSAEKVKLNDWSDASTKLSTYGANVTFQAELGKDFYAKSSVGYKHIKSDVEELKTNVGTAKLGVGYQFSPDLATEITYNHTFGSEKDNQLLKGGVGLQVKYYF